MGRERVVRQKTSGAPREKMRKLLKRATFKAPEQSASKIY
jgi:hypothetical protein